jgi:hypothetical protein
MKVLLRLLSILWTEKHHLFQFRISVLSLYLEVFSSDRLYTVMFNILLHKFFHLQLIVSLGYIWIPQDIPAPSERHVLIRNPQIQSIIILYYGCPKLYSVTVVGDDFYGLELCKT